MRVFLLFAIGFLLFGCTQEEVIIKNDIQDIIDEKTDDHGCLAEAGYVWCESKGKCLLPWEDPCESTNQSAQTPNQSSPTSTQTELTEQEAKAIAEASSCMQEGTLTGTPSLTLNPKKWWFSMSVDKPGCYAACVVDDKARTAEVVWNCPETTTTSKLTEAEARALAMSSECNKKTKLTDAPGRYDSVGEVWYFETELGPSCSCMVVEQTEAAGIDFQCQK